LVFARQTVHTFTAAALSRRGDESGLVELVDEIVEIVISLEDHVTTPAAIASAGPAFRPERFAMKRDSAFTAVTGLREHFDLIDEHQRLSGCEIKQEVG
jgi:hypothetical protein